MNKFKVGQRVKIIRTGKIGEIAELDNEDFDTEGRSNNCYRVRYKGWRYSYWFTVHDLEEVKDILTVKEKEYLSNIIKPFRDKVENIKKYDSLLDDEFGDKASDLRGKIVELEELIEKRENPSKVKILLAELKNLAIGVSGSLIASGIAAQIPLF